MNILWEYVIRHGMKMKLHMWSYMHHPIFHPILVVHVTRGGLWCSCFLADNIYCALYNLKKLKRIPFHHHFHHKEMAWHGKDVQVKKRARPDAMKENFLALFLMTFFIQFPVGNAIHIHGPFIFLEWNNLNNNGNAECFHLFLQSIQSRHMKIAHIIILEDNQKINTCTHVFSQRSTLRLMCTLHLFILGKSSH